MSAGRSVLLPAGAIEQIVEYETRSLPLAAPSVAGIAVVGSDVVVSVRLSRDAAVTVGERTSGALLVATGPEGVRYAVEIARVESFVTVVELSGRSIAADPWFCEATTSDGRKLPLLDVGRLLDELGASGEGHHP